MVEGKKRDSQVKGIKESGELPVYLIALLFVAFIVIFAFFYGQRIPSQPSNQTNQTGTGAALEKFLENLQASQELGIVMNISDTNSSHVKYVYACGAGLAGSWGRLGKNISSLNIYVVNETGCIYSNPSLQNQTVIKTIDECVSENRNRTFFDIRYGASYSVFTPTVEYIFVDETFTDECSFRAAAVYSGLGNQTASSANQSANQTVNQTSNQTV